MKKYVLVLGMMFASCTWGSPVTVQMLNIPTADPQPNFFLFDVDGVLRQLLCDQFLPNITTQKYTAMVATLDDLTGTALIRQGDSFATALLKYQWIAILDLWAYANPLLAPDVTRANRFIVDGAGAMTAGATELLDLVKTKNPADYNLSGFQIFVGVRAADGAFLDTQEQTGHLPVPEPATLILTISALGGFALLRRRIRPRV